MKNKLIFRILGALASALIIVSVFVPFISVTGYSTSLWESFQTTLYLPIMIIVFGAIGVIFFSLNVKTEFAYMSTGAISFFLVMRTIDILDQNAFNTLSVGYYFLVIGALLTGIMAFLTNLKSKNNKKELVESVPTSEPTMLDQIDKLYNDQTTVENQISPIQPIDSVIDPIPVQPIETIEPVQPLENQQIQVQNIQEQPKEVVPIEQTVEQVQVNPVEVQEQLVSENNIQENVENQMLAQPNIENINQTPVNPVLQEFAVEKPMNPVLQDFTQPTVNPVVQEFSMPVVNSQPEIQEQPIVKSEITPEANMNEPIPTNPVLQEFTNPGSTADLKSNSNDLDIFG